MKVKEFSTTLKQIPFRFIRKQRLKPVIATEIGTEFIKMLEINYFKDKPTIGRLLIKKITNPAQDLSSIYKSKIFLSKRVIAYLPRHLVSVKIVEFPSIDPVEIRDMVNVQISKENAYSQEEFIGGYRILKTYEAGYSDVIVAIPRYKVISERVEWLLASGFEVEKFSLSSECIYNWYHLNYLDSERRYDNTDMLIDINDEYIEFLIISQSTIVFTKAILIGTNYLQNIGGYDQWQSEFLSGLKDSLKIYHSSARYKDIDVIFLTGAQNINLERLQNDINKELKIPVRREKVIKKGELHKKYTQDLDEELLKSTSITALVGAGIKTRPLKIDLIPRALKVSKGMEISRRELTTMGTLLIGVVTLITLFSGTKIHRKISYLDGLKQQNLQIMKSAERIERMKMKIRLVEERLNAEDTILNMLDELFLRTPKTIYYKKMEIDEKRNIILRGRAATMSEIFNFITTLEESDKIANVKTNFTTTKETKEGSFAEFEISSKWQVPKDQP